MTLGSESTILIIFMVGFQDTQDHYITNQHIVKKSSHEETTIKNKNINAVFPDLACDRRGVMIINAETDI